jgi:putative PIN family toxin of toxin-antitoxin system
VRILLDSNGWISFFVSEGIVREIVDHCVLEHTVLISEWIVTEIDNTFRRKFKFASSDLDDAIFSLRKCKFVQESAVRPVCSDPDDDHILAAAKGGRADCIVTGDNDLLVLNPFEGIPILSPGAFWRFEEEGHL